MKHLIAFTCIIMLMGSLKAQINTGEPRPEFRTNSKSSKQFNPSVSLKSLSSAGKPRLDSCVYMVKENLTSPWNNGLKQEFKYDQNGIPVSSSFFYWDSETDKWIPIDKTEVGLNAEGNLIHEIYYEYSGVQFFPKDKEEIFYNTNGKISEKIISKYLSGALLRQEQHVYEYDINGFIKSIAQYVRIAIDQPWVYKMKYVYAVDNTGRIIEELLNDYDVNADGLINSMDWIRTTFVYNSAGNMTTRNSTTWDNDAKEWYVHSKTEYTYNSEAQKLTEKSYILNDESNVFEMRGDDEWIYDSNGNNTAYISRFIENLPDEWYMERTEFTYDLLALANDYSLPYGFELECVNKPLGIRYYDGFIDPDWILSYDGTYYYSDNILTRVNNISTSTITCFQQLRNFTFNWEGDEFLTFDVYNLSGQVVFSKRIVNNQTTTLENLSDGLYIYRLSNNKISASGKFHLK